MPTRRSGKTLLKPGGILAGRYRIDRMLGRGGFAEVYLGRHAEVDSLQVAIKVLHASHQDRDVIVGRFRREARLLALLRNRHTVRLIDFGFTDEGMGYLVMEYVRGAALDRLIGEQAPMRSTDVARVGIGVLKALDEAHSIGVIHRDLKPANVLLVNEPGERHAVPRVLDFGIAKVLGVADAVVSPDGGESVAGTRADMVFCTPLYASPELLRGKPDFRTDLYALGLVMAEMLDGRTPYSPEDCAKANSPHLERTPVPLGSRTRGSGLGDVIRRACAKRLTERYPSAVEMLADLEIAYESIREPDYKESPLLIVPTPPQTAERSVGDAASSLFVPASAGGGDQDFDSIVSFLSDATHIVPAERMDALRSGDSMAVVVDPIVSVPEAATPTDASVRSDHAHQRLRPVLLASLVLLVVAIAAVAWLLPRTSEAPSESVMVDGAAAASSVPPVPPRVLETTRVVQRSSSAVIGALTHARDSVLVVRSDVAATVRLDGIPVGEVAPGQPLMMRGPARRPFAVELVAPGVVFSRVVSESGAVEVDAELASLRVDAPAVEETKSPGRSAGRPTARRRQSRDGRGAATTAAPATSLGEPIRPRTQ